MLNLAELEHSAVKACVDALVDSRGGLLLYDHGLAGREALIAAGAQLATTAGLPLTLVDAETLRDDTTALLDHLGVHHHVLLSPAEAAHWPTGFTPNGVLAIHADVLLDPAVTEPLTAAAREASRTGNLLVARRPDSPSLLDAHTTQTHQLIAYPTTTTQTQAATDTQARYEPGPPSDTPARDDHSVDSPLPREPAGNTAPVAAATEHWTTPLRLIPTNPFPERATDWGEWVQAFTAAAAAAVTPQPNRIGEETIQRLREFYADLPAHQAAQSTTPPHEQPDVTSYASEPLADTSRPPAESPPSAERHQGPQQRPPASSSPSTPPAPEHGPIEIHQQTHAESLLERWPRMKAKQLVQEVTSPATPDTGSTEADAISYEELAAALEDPDLLQRAQQQAERMQTQAQKRLEQAAVAEHRWQNTRPSAAEEEHTPGSQPPQHDTAQRHAYSQDQATAQQPPRHHPGR
ncbi:hypothetical protein [Streptomyces noursei]|uniref:hypothetical protein n=1 Tax=Streptomyces noursei TaxID=1971 RepID=UPI003805C83C